MNYTFLILAVLLPTYCLAANNFRLTTFYEDQACRGSIGYYQSIKLDSCNSDKKISQINETHFSVTEYQRSTGSHCNGTITTQTINSTNTCYQLSEGSAIYTFAETVNSVNVPNGYTWEIFDSCDSDKTIVSGGAYVPDFCFALLSEGKSHKYLPCTSTSLTSRQYNTTTDCTGTYEDNTFSFNSSSECDTHAFCFIDSSSSSSSSLSPSSTTTSSSSSSSGGVFVVPSLLLLLGGAAFLL